MIDPPERSRLKPMTAKIDNFAIDTIDDLRVICVRKLMDFEGGILQQKEKLQKLYDECIAGLEKKLMSQIERSREKLFAIIDQYYHQCYDAIRKRMKPEVLQNINEAFQMLTQSLSSHLGNVSRLEADLNSSEKWWEGVTEIMNLDGNSQLAPIKERIAEIEGTLTETLPRVIISDQFLYSIGAEVKKFLVIHPKVPADVPQLLDKINNQSFESNSQFQLHSLLASTGKKGEASDRKIFSESPIPSHTNPQIDDSVINDMLFKQQHQSRKPHQPSCEKLQSGRPPGNQVISFGDTEHLKGIRAEFFTPNGKLVAGRHQGSAQPTAKSKKDSPPSLNDLSKVEASAPPEIRMKSYFDENCQRRYIHFFQDNSKKIHIFDLLGLESGNFLEHHEIDLDISFKIPMWHRSLITPSGDIYLTGGCESERTDVNLRTAYIFNYQTYSLDEIRPMNTGRNSHGICYFQGSIFVVGGCTDNEGYSAKCEALDISNGSNLAKAWRKIADLNYPANAPCLANFNDKKLFKFGGLLKIVTVNNFIEMFEPEKNLWSVIDYSAKTYVSDFNLLAYSSAIQVNSKEIYIFGGTENEAISNTTMVFRIDSKSEEYRLEPCSLRLPYYGTFWNNFSIVNNNKIYALQNIQVSKTLNYFLGKRKILCYDRSKWVDLSPEGQP